MTPFYDHSLLELFITIICCRITNVSLLLSMLQNPITAVHGSSISSRPDSGLTSSQTSSSTTTATKPIIEAIELPDDYDDELTLNHHTTVTSNRGCCICYADQNLTLPCSHLICYKCVFCLGVATSSNRSLKCPMCRVEHNV